MYDFLILGGDERMYCLFKMLRKNYTSKMDMWEEKAEKNEVFEDIKNSKNIILPIPSTRDKKTLNAPKSSLIIDICDIQNVLCDGQRLFYGLTSENENLITQKNSYNLLKDKRYTLQNSNATAEITGKIINEKYKFDAKNSVVLISGYGKIAKNLAEILKSDSNTVYIALRKKEYFDEIKTTGCVPIEISQKAEILQTCDIIINTVPSVIFSQKEMDKIRQSALVIDLASHPHGFEKSDKISVNLLLGLPGKYAPQKEAESLKEAIIKNL